MTTTVKNKIDSLVSSPSHSRQYIVEQLKQMLFDARAESTALAKSTGIEDDGQDNDLRLIELALQDQGVDPATS
ncbi:hypothetical protein [Cohaesibacter celericrescens]|uniref:hypothetical protein n=1 Tax=Cohaesibacter celericrescens TaxID=2067669 RepID=UPI003568608A